MILVVRTGASRPVQTSGLPTISETAHGEKVRALVRTTSSPEKVASLEKCGVELCLGDLKDTDSLVRALPTE